MHHIPDITRSNFHPNDITANPKLRIDNAFHFVLLLITITTIITTLAHETENQFLLSHNRYELNELNKKGAEIKSQKQQYQIM